MFWGIFRQEYFSVTCRNSILEHSAHLLLEKNKNLLSRICVWFIVIRSYSAIFADMHFDYLMTKFMDILGNSWLQFFFHLTLLNFIDLQLSNIDIIEVCCISYSHMIQVYFFQKMVLNNPFCGFHTRPFLNPIQSKVFLNLCA